MMLRWCFVRNGLEKICRIRESAREDHRAQLAELAAMVGAKSVEMGPCAVVLHAASGVRILLTSLNLRLSKTYIYNTSMTTILSENLS